MKKFITLLLLCLTGMAAWAADIENVAFKTDAGSYLAGTSDAIAMSSTAQSFTIKPVTDGAGACQLLNTDLGCWINSGSNGFLSYAAQSQTNNARHFYFYEVLTSDATSVSAIISATPAVGKRYVILVKNENGAPTSGFYAIYGQWASGKTNRLDVVNKYGDTAPTMFSLSTSNESSNGPIDIAKVVWTVEQLAAPEPPVDVTKTYYLKDTGISQYVVIPSATNANITPSTTDKTAVKFAAVSGGFSIQDANTGNYIGIDTSWNTISTTTAQPWAIAKVEGGITIKNTSGSYAGKWFGGQSGKTKFYNNNDNPIVFALEEAGAPEPPVGSDITKLHISFTNITSTGANVNVVDQSGNEVTGVSATVSQAVQNGTTNKNFFTTGAGYNDKVLGVQYGNAQNDYWEVTFTITGLSSFNGREIPSIDVCTPLLTSAGAYQGGTTVRTWDRTLTINDSQYGETLSGEICNNNNEVSNHFVDASATISGGQLVLKVKMQRTDPNGCFSGVKYIDINMPTTQTYTVNVTGATGGGVTYGGNTYNNGGKITASGLTVAELTAIPVEAYTCNITIDGTVINVVYTLNDINASINYTPLTTSCWSVMSNPPADLLTDYEATDLYDIEKTYVIEEAGKLQSTFVYTSGNHRIDIVGVDVVDGSGTVVASDYHFGYSGGQKVDNVYTVKIPAGTYTVRYIATAHSADGSNTNTNGHIDNVFTAGEIDWNGLEAAITTANSYPVGHGLGQYSWIEEGADYTDDWDSTISSYEQILEAREGDADYVDFLIDLLNTAISNLQLNMPKAGTFLRVKGAASGNYIAGDNSISNGRAAMTAEKDASSILYYTEDGELIGYQSGLGFINTHSRAAVGNTFEHHSFSASNYGNKGAYTILSNYGGSKVLYDGSTDINRNSAANSVNCAWYLEEVTELPVTITTAGYATLYAPVDLTVPTGVEAYSITEAKDEYLTPSELATIPANTGVVLKAAAGTYNFAIAETAGSGTSLLDGTCATIASAEADGNYVFSIVGGNPGFYKFAGTELKGFKAYYKPAVANINGFSIDFGGQIVGVSTVMGATNLKAGYDIQGRRINKMQKGINILNGQKIIK